MDSVNHIEKIGNKPLKEIIRRVGGWNLTKSSTGEKEKKIPDFFENLKIFSTSFVKTALSLALFHSPLSLSHSLPLFLALSRSLTFSRSLSLSRAHSHLTNDRFQVALSPFLMGPNLHLNS